MAVVLILVGTALVGLAGASTSLLAPRPAAVHSAAAAKDGPLPFGSADALRGALVGKIPAALLSKVPDSVLLSEERSLVYPNVNAAPPLKVYLATAAVVAAICIVAGVLSAGLACLGAIVGAVATLAILYLLGVFDANAQATAAAKNLAFQLLSDQAFMSNQQSSSVATTVNALNLTSTALGYQAAAAGLSQLPNVTFNVPLALSVGGASSVGAEMASEFSAAGSWLAAYVAKDIADFGRQEGTLNQLAKWCPVYYLGSTYAFPSDAAGQTVDAGSACGANLGNPLYYGSGHAYGGTPPITMGSTSTVGTCPIVYIASGTWITLTDAGASTFTGSFIPVAGDLAWTNVTATAVPDHALINVTWTAASGGYYLCAPSGTVVFYGGDVFPLTSKTVGAQPWAPNVYWAPSDNNASLGSGAGGTAGAWVTLVNSNVSACALCFFDELFDGSAQVYAVNLYGGNVNASQISASTPAYGGYRNLASPFLNFGNSLMNLEKVAGLVGSTYWNFLQTIGYTSVGQVPARCLIPTLGQLLPSTIPISELAGMNVTTALNLYYAQLLALGFTYNATNGLTVTNFCGHHLTWNPYNSTFGFGVYGYGWVFLKGSSALVKSSDGLVNQTFGTPSTWNLSGLIFISGSLHNYTVPLNSTFLLGKANPTTLMVIPFVKFPTKAGAAAVVNRTAPTWCLGAGRSGCNLSWANFVEVNLVTGNSTTGFGLSGSVFPTGASVGTGGDLNASVYLTVCFRATSAYTVGDPVYKTATSCVFNTSSLNASGSPCGTSLNGCANQGGGILIATGGACGVTFPLLGTLTNAIASVTGTSSLGCLVAEALAVIALIIVVVIVIYAAIAVVRYGTR